MSYVTFASVEGESLPILSLNNIHVHLFVLFSDYTLRKNPFQQMEKLLLLWQVGLIANVKLHFLIKMQKTKILNSIGVYYWE